MGRGRQQEGRSGVERGRLDEEYNDGRRRQTQGGRGRQGQGWRQGDDRSWRVEGQGREGQPGGRDFVGVDEDEARDWDFELGEGGREERGESWRMRGEERDLDEEQLGRGQRHFGDARGEQEGQGGRYGGRGGAQGGRESGQGRYDYSRGEYSREGRQGYGGDRY